MVSVLRKSKVEEIPSLEELEAHLRVELPDEVPEGWRLVEKYWITPNIEGVRILTDGSQYLYELVCPTIDQRYKETYNRLRELVLEQVPNHLGDDDIKVLYNAFWDAIRRIETKKFRIPIEDKAILWYHIKRDSLYAGKITPLLKDPLLEDISCSGYGKPVYVYHRSYESIPTNISFNEEELDTFVLSVAQKSGVELSIANPIADTILYEGSRVNLTFRSEVTHHGSTFTIRKIRKVPITPIQLIKWGTFSPEEFGLLWLCIESNSSMLFVGGTAAGKTTAMNATALFIPIHSKIVSIEDTREIILPHENWIPSVARGNITMFDLLKAALRQRPEYIIVGEVRGKEAEIMFQAMGLGHTCLSTVHGNTAEGVLDRLMGPPYNIPPSMIQNLDIVVIISRLKLGDKIVRRCRGLWLVDVESNEVKTTPLFRWTAEKDVHLIENLKPLFKRLGERLGRSIEELQRDWERRVEIVRKLVEKDVPYEQFLVEILKGGVHEE